VITGTTWSENTCKRLIKEQTYASPIWTAYRQEARDALKNTIDNFESYNFVMTLWNVFCLDGAPGGVNPRLKDNWRDNFPLIYHIVRGNRTFPTTIHKKVFKQELFKMFAEDGVDILSNAIFQLVPAYDSDEEDEDDDSVEDVADATLHAYVPPSQDANAIRRARCADNDDTEMNTATKIVLNYIQNDSVFSELDAEQKKDISNDTELVYSLVDLDCETKSDDFDKEYYQVFYADRKSACVNWCLIAKTLRSTLN
jgi:hypothetical protein